MKNRVGEIKEGKYGTMEIIEYNKYSNIKVKFKTGSIVKTQYGSFENGQVKDPLFPNIFGIGYLGIGEYKPTTHCKSTIEYQTWKHMLSRCYNPYKINKCLTYQNVIVCENWWNFQNFAKWHKEKYYQTFNNEIIHLDKDLIKRDNKIYSPEFCSFVPQSINTLIIGCNSSRGKYPIGVYFNKNLNKYMSRLNIGGKSKFLGYFSTPLKAFNVYKIAKEKNIKIMANKYKEVLDVNVYESLMQYKVEITD